MASDDAKEKKAKALEKKHQAKRYDEWLAEKRPDIAKKIDKRQYEQHMQTGTPEPLTYAITRVVGDAKAQQLAADYERYKKHKAEELADDVDAHADQLPEGREYKTGEFGNQQAFERRSGALGKMNNPNSAAGTPGAKKGGGTSFDPKTGILINGDAATGTFSYDGLAQVLNMNPQASFNEALSAYGETVGGIDPAHLRVAVSGAGMNVQDIPNQIMTKQAALQADKSAKPGRGDLWRKDVSGVGAMLGAVKTGYSRSYPESMAYLGTLTPDQLTRAQQHLAMAGYFGVDPIKSNTIMWGYADDMTRQAWAQLHLEADRDKLSLAEELKLRENAFAPTLNDVLTGRGTGGDVSAREVQVNLSDPATVKSATQDAFFRLLGRAPTEAEQDQMVKSIHSAENADGMQRKAQIGAIEKRNAQRRAQASGLGAPLTPEETMQAQGEIENVLGVGTPSGNLVMPVAGKNSFGNDIGQARSGGRRHQGTDIFAAEGTPVVAAVSGYIAKIGTGGVQGKMKSISITGSDKKNYFYNHLGDQVAVKPGQFVQRGQVIGSVGNAQARIGTGNHLHFSINEGRPNMENPYPLLKNAQKSGTASTSRLPVGPGGVEGGAAAAVQEDIPIETIVGQNVDPRARLEQEAREKHPGEFYAHGLGTAYYKMIDMFMAGPGGGNFGGGPVGGTTSSGGE